MIAEAEVMEAGYAEAEPQNLHTPRCGWGRCNRCGNCGAFASGHSDQNLCANCGCPFIDHD